jgi:hypothetical protein
LLKNTHKTPNVLDKRKKGVQTGPFIVGVPKKGKKTLELS